MVDAQKLLSIDMMTAHWEFTYGAKRVNNGMDVDLKLAARVRGIDAILGGHTHDAVPRPVLIANSGGKTLVVDSGCNTKFLSLLDLDVRGGRVVDYRYRLLPEFAELLPADAAMSAYIEQVRAPCRTKLEAPLAVTEGLLYRRGNFSGTFDQLIVDAAARRARRRGRVLARLPLGYDPAAGRCHHVRALAGPDGGYLCGCAW